MVSDKVNYRTTGPMTATTKQPTKGRANGGGLQLRWKQMLFLVMV